MTDTFFLLLASINVIVICVCIPLIFVAYARGSLLFVGIFVAVTLLNCFAALNAIGIGLMLEFLS